jgi:hypothetical protein
MKAPRTRPEHRVTAAASTDAAQPIRATLSIVLGEREAVVLDVTPFDLHGVRYADLTLTFQDRSVATARLGPESVPEGIAAGDRVLATMAANMIVAVRRADTDD